MPLNLSKVLSKSVELEVEWEGEKIGIEYRIGEYTSEYVYKMDATPNFKAAQFIVDLVSKWDVTDDTGKVVEGSSEKKPLPVPLDLEHIEKLPISLGQIVVAAIMRDQANPNRNKQTS